MQIILKKLRENAPPPHQHDENCELCDLDVTDEFYLLKDVIGSVSFQKSLVENVYVTPFWFNGAFVRKDVKPMQSHMSKSNISKIK